MIDEHIEKTKSAIESAGSIPADKKAELLGLLSKLKPTIAKVSETHHEEHAQSIARLVETSTHEAARKNRRPELLEKVLRELRQSVEKFEASHPELVASVNEYSTLLSALGI
jgi:prefoldin subunit 5